MERILHPTRVPLAIIGVDSKYLTLNEQQSAHSDGSSSRTMSLVNKQSQDVGDGYTSRITGQSEAPNSLEHRQTNRRIRLAMGCKAGGNHASSLSNRPFSSRGVL